MCRGCGMYMLCVYHTLGLMSSLTLTEQQGAAEAPATFMTRGYTVTTRRQELNNAEDASRIYLVKDAWISRTGRKR